MPTGYDLLEHSHEFRMHMLRRLAAGLIDVALIFIPVMLFVYLIDLEPKEIFVGVFSGFFWFLYSTIMESIKSTTVGKKICKMIVVSIDGPMTLSKSIIRNVPKMFWFIFLPFDIFLGLASKYDPRGRWVDIIAQTVVIKKNE